MLGFAILAIASMLRGNLVTAVVVMTLAVNFKITAFYYILPFGVFALVQVIKKSSDQNKGKMLLFMTLRICLLLIVFFGINLLLWWPWLFEKDQINGSLKLNYEPAL